MAKPKKKQPLGQTIGGVLFGFEQQVLRTMPPPQELVHHARPDDPMPAGDGGFVRIEMPDGPPVPPLSGEPVLDLPEPTPEPGVDEP
jgi:hypothetical protein